MKKIYAFIVAVVLITNLFSQAPQKMSYQAVIRNSSNVLITSAQIGIRVSILQGSATGTEVYKEIYNPNPLTNANGLLSLEIGSGIPITGTFASINWANGPYFIKTETDPAGGTNYTITGTSQFLSVPFALHAKTAENGFTGVYNDLTGKPDFSKWDKDSTDNVTITGNQTIAGDKTFTGTINANNQKITNVSTPINSTDAANKAYVDALNTHYVGQLYGGGVVFYVDQTGQHGLISSMITINYSTDWSNINAVLIGTTAQSDWDGLSNSNSIVGQGGHTGSAAKICFDYINTNYGTGVYSDWYLPSLAELKLIWDNLYLVQKALENDGDPATTTFGKAIFWSSTEYFTSSAWSFYFSLGYANNGVKSGLGAVRAVRAF